MSELKTLYKLTITDNGPLYDGYHAKTIFTAIFSSRNEAETLGKSRKVGDIRYSIDEINAIQVSSGEYFQVINVTPLAVRTSAESAILENALDKLDNVLDKLDNFERDAILALRGYKR